MKLRFLLSCAAVALTTAASAQLWVYDSVVMGPGYTNDVYYGVNNGVQKTPVNTDWHLAFQMTPQGQFGNVSVWANHVMGGVQVFSLHKKASTSFTTLTAADTVGKTAAQLYNTDSSWNFGAFNRMSDPTNLIDYSWGFYDQTTHNVNGDSLYLLKIGASGDAYKLWIQQYVSYPVAAVSWKFRIAKFDGTGDTTVIMKQTDYTDRLFGYWNVLNRTAADREPNKYLWQMVFTRYIENVTQGSVTQPYPVTGVLSNQGTTVADVRGVSGDTAHYQNYTFSKKLDEIGSDWKTYDMSQNKYVIDTGATFFIMADTNKLNANPKKYWQIKFSRFDGSSTGKIVFAKRNISSEAIPAIAATALNAWALVPNPAVNEASIMVDARESVRSARILVTDLNGRTVQQSVTDLQKGMNAFSFATGAWANGTYIVHITNGTWKVSDKLVVMH